MKKSKLCLLLPEYIKKIHDGDVQTIFRKGQFMSYGMIQFSWSQCTESHQVTNIWFIYLNISIIQSYKCQFLHTNHPLPLGTMKWQWRGVAFALNEVLFDTVVCYASIYGDVKLEILLLMWKGSW